MCAEDGLEDTELHPPEHQFGVGADVVGLQIAAAVVSPITEADVGGGGRDVALELQGAVGGKRVAREADRVAVAAHSAPAVEDDGTAVRAVQAHVVVEDVVEPERLPQAADVFAGEVLLPVDPPEVNALLLADTHDVLEEGAVEGGVLQLPRHGGDAGIETHAGTNLSEVVIAGANAVSGMQVECRLCVVGVHPAQQRGGTGEERLVPRPARPGVLMPVAVDHEYIVRHVFVLHVAQKLLHLALLVSLVLAVPVAEHVLGGQGLTACNADIVAQGVLVLVAVAEEVPVDGVCVDRLTDPGNTVHLAIEGETVAAVATFHGRRFVEDGPAVAREQTFLQRNAVCVADIAVQGTLCAKQVQSIVLARVPEYLSTVHPEGDAQHRAVLVLAVDSTAHLVTQGERVGLNGEVAALLATSEVGDGQTPVDDGKRGAVFEGLRRAILDAYQPGREHREACRSAHDDRLLLWQGIPSLVGKGGNDNKEEQQKGSSTPGSARGRHGSIPSCLRW